MFVSFIFSGHRPNSEQRPTGVEKIKQEVRTQPKKEQQQLNGIHRDDIEEGELSD